MTQAMPFLRKIILLSYDPRPFAGGYLFVGKNPETIFSLLQLCVILVDGKFAADRIFLPEMLRRQRRVDCLP